MQLKHISYCDCGKCDQEENDAPVIKSDIVLSLGKRCKALGVGLVFDTWWVDFEVINENKVLCVATMPYSVWKVKENAYIQDRAPEQRDNG